MADERIDRDSMYLQICMVMAQRGSCRRAQVACVITRDNRILSTGYNGPAKDQPHCSDKNCDLTKSCKRAIHAETNAIAFAAKYGISLNGSTMYCLYSPCLSCAQLIVPTGVIKVIYNKTYHTDDGAGKEFLESSGIILEQIEIPSFVILADKDELK